MNDEKFTVLHFNSLNEFLAYLDSQSKEKESNDDTSLRGKVRERKSRTRRNDSKIYTQTQVESYKRQVKQEIEQLTKALHEKEGEIMRLKHTISDLVGTIHSIKENVNKLTDITV